jgi:hypothetical protein
VQHGWNWRKLSKEQKPKYVQKCENWYKGAFWNDTSAQMEELLKVLLAYSRAVKVIDGKFSGLMNTYKQTKLRRMTQNAEW